MSSSMVAPAAGGLARVREWVQTHQAQAAAGAGAVGVGAYALYKRRVAGSGEESAADAAAGTPGTAGADPNLVTAGLSGTPATSGTDIETWVQDALNASQNQNNDRLDKLEEAAAAKPPAATTPTAPPAAPRPGALRYTVRKGDTLSAIAQRVYGNSTPIAMQDIRRANPILASFPAGARLDVFAGNVLTISQASPQPKPAAKKAATKKATKPAPRRKKAPKAPRRKAAPKKAKKPRPRARRRR